MTLRIVQLRDVGGNLITIPYGTANAVVNYSRYWSRIDYRIVIAGDADVGKALTVLRQTIEDLAQDEAFRGAILDAIEWIGVDSASATGIALRACVRTAPLRQFDLRREINARTIAAFRSAGIELGLDPGATTVVPRVTKANLA